MSADVDIRFGANTSGFDAAASRLRSQLGSIGSSVNGLNGTLNSMKGGFGSIISSLSGGGLNAAVSGFSELGGAATGAAGAMGPLGIAVAATAAAAAAAYLPLMALGESMGALAEKTDQTSQKLGLTRKQVQEWNAVAANAGVSSESFSMSMMRLERSLYRAQSGSKGTAQAFKDLGVDIRKIGSADEAMTKVGVAIGQMENVSKRNALAIQLMGRSAGNLIPLFKQGESAINDQKKQAYEYGVVMGSTTEEVDAFIDKGLAVDDALDQQSLGMQGLKNIMFNELAPTIVELTTNLNDMIKNIIRSYREGGSAKTIFSGLATTVKILASAVDIIVTAFVRLWYAIKVGLNTVVGPLLNFSALLGDIFTGNFVGALDRWKARSRDWAVSIASDFNSLIKAGSDFATRQNNLWNPKPIPKGEAIPEEVDLGEGEAPSPKPKKPKKGPDPRKVAEEALKKELEALDIKMEALQEDYDKQMALEEQKLAKLEAFYGKDSNEYKKELNRKEAMVRAHQQKVNALTKIATEHRTAMETLAADETKAILEDELAQEQAALDHRLAMEEINASQHLALSAKLHDRLFAGQLAHEEEMWRIKKAAFESELKLPGLTAEEIARVNARLEEAEREHQNKMAAIKRGQGASQKADTTKGQELAKNNLDQLAQPMVDGFQNAFNSILTGQKTFKAAMLEMIRNMVTETIMQLALIPIKWAANQIVMTIATKLGIAERLGLTAMGAATETAISGAKNTAQITGAAGVAAAEGAKSQAGIPIVGPALAALAAAGMLALVLGFASMISAEGGYDVPSSGGGGLDGKGGQFGIFHPNEMILPAKIANPLRAMLAGPQTANLAGDAASAGYNAATANRQGIGGDVHYHDNTERGLSPSQIVANRAALSKAIKMAHREGRFVGTKVLRA